jgi:hypothetical protein
MQGKCTGVTELRAAIKEASGIDELSRLLQERFFARSKMIKFFSVISKAWEPCQTSLGRLRQFQQKFEHLHDSAENNLAILDGESPSEKEDMQPLADYVAQTGDLIKQQLELTEEVSTALESHIVSLTDAFTDMQADIDALEVLDQYPGDFDELPVNMLKCVCGANGPGIDERAEQLLGKSNSLAETEQLIEQVRHVSFTARQRVKPALEHLVTRFEQLADHFEELDLASSLGED